MSQYWKMNRIICIFPCIISKMFLLIVVWMLVVIWVLIRLFWCTPLQYSVSPDMVHVNCCPSYETTPMMYYVDGLPRRCRRRRATMSKHQYSLRPLSAGFGIQDSLPYILSNAPCSSDAVIGGGVEQQQIVALLAGGSAGLMMWGEWSNNDQRRGRICHEKCHSIK